MHPGGLVFGLARDLGADTELSLAAASVCEMFYAACSVTDDLQDGDTDEYLGHLPMSLRINSQIQLLSLVAVRFQEVVERIPQPNCQELVQEVYRTLSVMLTGQRMEILRAPWDIGVYETVARLSAGEQFATYMKIASVCADRKPEAYCRFGNAVGVCLQVLADIETADTRLTALPGEYVSLLLLKVTDELSQAAMLCENEFVTTEAERLLERCCGAQQSL